MDFIWWVKAAMHTRNSSRPWHPWFLCTKVSYKISGGTLQVKWSFCSSSFMLGNSAKWSLRNLSLLPCCLQDEDFFTKTVLRMGMKSKFNHTLPLHHWLHQSNYPPWTMRKCYKNGCRCITPIWNCGESQILWGFFYTVALWPAQAVGKMERVKCDGFWELLPSLVQVFPARQLKNGNSWNRMHISFCSLLTKKSVMTDTISRVAVLCFAMALALPPSLVLASTRTRLQGPATHCRGRRKSSEWLFDPPVPNPVYILMWSEKPSTQAVFKFWEKCAMPQTGDNPSREDFTAGWWKSGLVAHGSAPQTIQDWPRNCSRFLQRWFACPPPGLPSSSSSTRFLNLGFPTARPFSSCLAFFLLVHPHNYSSTKSGLVKQQHFKKLQTLISRQSFPPTSSPFKQGCQPCCFFQTFSESSHQAACKYLNASINVKSK